MKMRQHCLSVKMSFLKMYKASESVFVKKKKVYETVEEEFI